MSTHYLKKSFYSAVVFSTTVIAISLGYASLSGGLSLSDKVGTGSGLAAGSWNRIIDGMMDLDSKTNALSGSLSSQFNIYGNSNTYNATNIPLTTAAQNFATVMTLPSAGSYFIWINARVDMTPLSNNHFFLSSTPAGSPLFGMNYITNTSPAYSDSTTFTNMGVLTVSNPTTIYVGGKSGSGMLSWIGVTQSTAGYLKLK